MNFEQCKNQAISDLESYSYLKASLSTLPPQIELLKEISEIKDFPFTSAADTSLCNADTCADRINVMQLTLKHNTLKVCGIEAALNSLSESDRELLNGFYINRQRNSVNVLARKNFTDRSCIYRRVQHALTRYILSYFGTTVSDVK